MTAILDRSAAVEVEPTALPARFPLLAGAREATLAGMLRARARTTPDRPAYLFLADGEEEGERMSWGDLDRRARAVAAALGTVAAPGDRALLLYPPGLEFIAAFFGCLYAGVVAVPAYPPRPRRDQPRLRAIVRDAAPRVALTTGALDAAMAALAVREPELAALRRLATDELSLCTDLAGAAPGGAHKLACGSDSCAPSSLAPPAPRAILSPAALDPAAPAFLQYTSGSTALPKGVIVSHANLMHNERMIAAAFGQDEESVVVGWLPLYHDMGLIGNVLQPLYSGGRCVLMSPTAFLQRPRRWLEAIDRHRATTSGGPNFAYELCAQKIAAGERQGLDLSSWRVAYNGAEPVRAETLDRFAEAFGACGFDRRAFFPCYGLAEGTLLVAGGRSGEGARTLEVSATALERHAVVPVTPGTPARRLVASGRPHLGQRVVIADPETCALLPTGRVGEIWVAGSSVAGGYWGRPEATASEFQATLASGDGPYLRTGDLGFLAKGELFVTGRLKDLIILRGRNHYPQDLELTAERAHPALKPGCGAAFSVEGEGDEERLVVVYEVDRHAGDPVTAIAAAVRGALAEEHEVQLAELVLIRQGTCPKTSSGKVERRSCRARHLAGELEVVGHDRLGAEPAVAATEPAEILAQDGEGRPARIEACLAAALARVTRVAPAAIDRDQPMTAYGLDSLAAVELANAVEAELGSAPALAELLAGISLAQAARQILDLAAGAAVETLPAATVETDPAALSHGQRALFIAHRLDPEGAAYNLAGAARLSGAEPEALRRAFQALVDRHGVLRTTYTEGPNGPVQRVEPQAEVAFARFDAAEWSAEELDRRLRHEAFRPFDLERGPVFRVALFVRPDDPAGSVLVVAVHHIAADFWSFAVLARELGALLGGAPVAALGPTPPAYAEWARWQEARLAGPRGEELWRRWSERLAGVPALELPTDRPRPAVQSFRGATRAFALAPAATAALHALAAAHGATFFTVLLAGYQALLARLSGQDDFAVGSPTGNRGGARFDGLVGYLVNPVALRAELAGDLTVAGHLGRVRRTVLEALSGQELPFALLAERLRPERDPSRPPLVQTLLAFEQAPAGEGAAALAPLAAFALGLGGARLELGPLVLESVDLPSPASPFDLSLLAAELPGGLALAFQYCADLFDGTTLARFAGHLEIVLAAMAAEPGARLADLPLLSPAERHQLAWELNPAAAADEAEGETLHRLFEMQAERRPAAVAVDHGGRQLTYGELEARASRLALHLLAHGVEAEGRVGVSLPRSPAALVALLAVLKAGGAYLPVDPSYPRSRRAHLLADSRAAVLIADRAAADDLPDGLDLELLLVDGTGAPVETEEAVRRVRGGAVGSTAVLPSQLAYVIYTSGSTGLPKGVEVGHAAAAAHVETARREYGIEASDRVLQFAAAGFDVALEQVFATWAAGAVLVLRGEEPWSPAELSGQLACHGVTVANLPTTYWHGWLREAAAAGTMAPPALRLVIAGGEAMPPEAARLACRTASAGARLVNAYGPTEAVMTASLQPLADAPGDAAVAVPVGRPMARRSAWVADREGRLLPLGAPGELLLGGLLARGYLGRPELSAERFIPHPWAPESSGERLYRTGDLARLLPGGEVEVLGRLDRQVKVRGFRIELGEIEAALALHPAVGGCAVLARADGPGERRLVAYVVGPEAHGLREFLAARLPEPMVPGAFVFLPELPLTPNGKVDLRALPAPAVEEVAAPYAAPRGAVEERLAEIWQEVLRLPRVGVDDNFFALGGDSILGLQLLSRAAEAGIRLSLRQIFRHPTIAELAAAADLGADTVVEDEPAADELTGEVPLTPMERWFFAQEIPRPAHWNWSAARLLTVAGMPARGLLERALDALSRQHDALRLRFAPVEGGWRQTYAPVDAGVPLTRIDLSALPAVARPGAITALAAAAQTSLDLTQGPLLRAVLFDLGAGRPGRLLLVVHHLVMDGVSWRILLEDLATACRQLEHGKDVRLPARTASFGCWARRLAGHAESAELAAELPYWRAQGRRATPLPLDFPRHPGDNREASAETVHRTLDSATTRALLGDAHQAYGTRVDDLLRAALVKSFSRLTGRRRLLVDLEGHGRELFADLDLSRTVGWLTALHRVCLDLGPARGTGAELAAIKEQGREIPRGGAGYGILRYLAGQGQGADGAGLGEAEAEVLFNYLGRAEVAGADAAWALADEPAGPAVDPAAPRSHLVVINCWIADGQLEVEWSYSRDLHRRATVERLADDFLGALEALVGHCLEPGAGAWSPSDFPEADLGERELGNLLLKLGGSERGAAR